jgi:hypothetical protein
MKNIYVLLTDKPSRLHITYRLDLYPNRVSRKPQGLCKNQHIYITTDGEIKEGDWFLEKAGRQYPIQWNGIDKLNRHCKKIILTTDPLLDGVQAIDDEFLEWFVKNPSREYVNFTSHGNEKRTKDYELIIPKEVPKQECDANVLTCLNEKCICKSEKIKTGYTASETELIGVQITLKDGSQQFIPKQETLEEVDYEKLKQLLIEFRKVPITFVPDERMYSEEEVLDILRKSHSIEQTSKMDSWITKWFEQFKKK